MSRACQLLALRILYDDAPRVLLYLYAAVGRCQCISFLALGASPRAHVHRRLLHQYHFVGIVLGLCRTGIETQSHRAAVHRLYAELQLRTLVVCRTGEVEVLKRRNPVSVGVESLSRMHLMAAPLQCAGASSGIKTYQRVGAEHRVGGLHETLADVVRL